MNQTIAIIGHGNMGHAIAQGLLRKKITTKHNLFLTNSKTNNKEAVEKANIVILCIKPQVAYIVLEEIKDVVKKQLVISVMAGVTIKNMQNVLGKHVAIIRVMPNLGASVGQSMSVWTKNEKVEKTDEHMIKTILRAIGKEQQVSSEKEIDMATAISGSGPAYFFHITYLLQEAGERLGFTKQQASLLAKQTLLGSATLLKESEKSAEELRLSVTSKGGTTEAAFAKFQQGNFNDVFLRGVFAAYKKSRALKISR